MVEITRLWLLIQLIADEAIEHWDFNSVHCWNNKIDIYSVCGTHSIANLNESVISNTTYDETIVLIEHWDFNSVHCWNNKIEW